MGTGLSSSTVVSVVYWRKVRQGRVFSQHHQGPAAGSMGMQNPYLQEVYIEVSKQDLKMQPRIKNKRQFILVNIFEIKSRKIIIEKI